MKGGAQAALAIGVGYILGRRRKMRLATMLAAAAATGGLAKLGPVALKRGAKLLDSTELGGALGPQVTEIVSTIRGELLDAGKAAAAAAVTSRVDSLSENLHDRAEMLRDPEAAVAGAGRAGETAGRQTVGRLRRRGRGADAEDAELDGDSEERRNGRSRREQTRSRSTRSEEDEGREPEDEYEEYEDEEPDAYEADEPEDDLDEVPADEADDIDAEDAEDEDAEEPAPRRRRTSRSPVTRTRR